MLEWSFKEFMMHNKVSHLVICLHVGLEDSRHVAFDLISSKSTRDRMADNNQWDQGQEVLCGRLSRKGSEKQGPCKPF